MPVRSLSSSVFTWPDAGVVEQAVRQWAHQTARQNAGIRRVGYFGSYARGDWGVGSDVDLIIVVDRAEEPFPRRVAQWDLTDLPVPAEALVYTASEWASMRKQTTFGRGIDREAVWVYENEGA